jgi:hypothetical protein
LTGFLGHNSVKDCQRHISSHEFAEWMAYFTIEPFGDDLIDLQFSQLEALLANVNRSKKGRAFKPEDFLLRQVKEPEQPKTPGQVYQNFKANLGL